MGNDTFQLMRRSFIVVTLFLLAVVSAVTTVGAQTYNYTTDFTTVGDWVLVDTYHIEGMIYSLSETNGSATLLVDHPGGNFDIQISARKTTETYNLSSTIYDPVSTTDYCLHEWTITGNVGDYYESLTHSCVVPAGQYELQLLFLGGGVQVAGASLSAVPPATATPTATATATATATGATDTPTPTGTPIPTPTGTLTPIPTVTTIPTATPDYGRVITATMNDIPVRPSSSGVDLESMGLPPLPEPEGLLNPDAAPKGELKIVFTLEDFSDMISLAQEAPSYIFGLTIWRVLIFFALVTLALKVVAGFVTRTNSSTGGPSTPTHINRRN